MAEEMDEALSALAKWKFVYPFPDIELDREDIFLDGWNNGIAAAMRTVRRSHPVDADVCDKIRDLATSHRLTRLRVKERP